MDHTSASVPPPAPGEETVGGFILENAPAVQVAGAYMIAGYLVVLFLYLFWCWVDRWWRSRGVMSEVSSGKFRLAASKGRVDVMAAASESVPNFDIDASVCGFTALHAACCQGQLGAVLWLCQNGASVNAIKCDGWMYTALHYAACRGDLECVKILCAFGADVACVMYTGATPSALSSQKGYDEVALYLDSVSSGTVVPDKSVYAGRMYVRDVSQDSTWKLVEGYVDPCSPDALSLYLSRGYEGIGTPGTEPGRFLKGFRILAVFYLCISACYLVWRALRSLKPGWWYFYSIPFWLFESISWTLGLCFVYSLYYQIDRPGRDISAMLEQEEFPMVDIFICRYSEPVEVLEATVVAALNIDYPGDKLCVYILDDGSSAEVKSMHRRLVYQMRYMGRQANLKYVARPKVSGVPHHAKAGNINHSLLTESSPLTDYILVLDCDMIIHPTFLRRTLGHFLRLDDSGVWRLKDFAALLQTPQDFWNVDKDDPMVHCARFFYGPMLMGRDGAGALPCCGTGVLFNRDILVSVGGQSYGSVTEDCNTAMQLLSSGFANMFMDERLVFGMAPETLSGVFQQRLRWAMGAIQILYRDNPLRKRGLTPAQAFLFFEIGAHHYLAFGTAFMAVVPLLYVFLSASPIAVKYLWEFCIVFGVFFISNRLMIWWAHKGCPSGGSLELWRGGQMWVWMCPNHVEASIKTFFAEAPLIRHISFEITFHVTEKRKGRSNLLSTFLCTWIFVLYLLASAASLVYFVVFASLEKYSSWEILIKATAVMWSLYLCMCIWPPVSLLLPRIETNRGWKISWNQTLDESQFVVDEKKRVVKRSQFLSKIRMGSQKSLQRIEEGKYSTTKKATRNIFRTFSENAGRIALPERTAKTLLQSGMYTSTILPEPSRVSRADSKRVDTRHLSINQMYSQMYSKGLSAQASRFLEDRSAYEHCKRFEGVKTMQKPKPQEYRPKFEVSTDGTVYKNGKQFGVEGLTENVIAQLRLESEHPDSSNEIMSPFLQHLDGVSSKISGNHPVDNATEEGSLIVTRSGRVFKGETQVPLTTLLDHCQGRGMIAPDRSSSTEDLASPFEQMTYTMQSNQGRSAAPGICLDSHAVNFDSAQARSRGREILRSMMISYSEIGNDVSNASKNSHQSMYVNHRLGMPLGSRSVSKQGSLMLSALFSHLSQMQPSELERRGFVIPVIPDSVFDHTIAAIPSFEFRVFPKASIWFFLVNISILCGVIAAGILSIFYKES